MTILLLNYYMHYLGVINYVTRYITFFYNIHLYGLLINHKGVFKVRRHDILFTNEEKKTLIIISPIISRQKLISFCYCLLLFLGDP